MLRPAWALVFAAGLFLSACASTSTAPPASRPGPSAHAPPPPRPSKPAPQTEAAAKPAEPSGPADQPAPHEPFAAPRALASLPGWAEEDHLAALVAFQAGCGVSREPGMRAVCQQARALGRPTATAARVFFEENFQAQPVADASGPDGLLTAYFAPEYEARQQPDAEFSAPVRPRPGAPLLASPPPADPTDPIDVVLAESEPAPVERVDLSTATRTTIERAPAPGASVWMRPEDLFFLQIQGSGVLTFPDGRRMKATYAADNGRPFVAIARPMIARGLLTASGASGDAIRAWLAAHRGPEAAAIMALNPRYVFFNIAPDDGREPPGAAGVPLPAGRAIAVDPSRHTYGELFWIDAAAPTLSGAFKTYRRLAVALDTGSAIRGEVRADLYIGRGTAAGSEAGRVRHTLRMTRLTPVERRASAERAVPILENARHEAATAAGGG